jgi:hypothetical protein
VLNTDQFVTGPGDQARALAETAGALAQTGQHEQAAAVAEQALTAARSVARPYDQARTLAEIAGVLTRAGERHCASRAAATACAVGHWEVAAASVFLLEPTAPQILIRTLT